ncbi:MAG: radical SAM protein [Candidatus Omnitrophica bacterium]|nr:radical SAM protein [Candidatus Omnitrophota bacterium]
MDEFRVDSHKLIYHIERLYQWNKGEDIYPIYIEISPFGGCNQRCIFCALDYLEYKPNCLDTPTLENFLKDISRKGVKSIMFAGEGEPLLHKDISHLVMYANRNGLGVAITTNGILLSGELLKEILPSLSWLRISLNAGGEKTYSFIHGAGSKDFHKVMENIKQAVKLKKENGYSTTIGVQFLLLNENYKEASILAEKLKAIGVNYLIIKPYSQHPQSLNRLKSQLNYEKLLSLKEQLRGYEDKDFRIIFRKKTMLKIREQKPYKKCLGLPFWSYLTSMGDLYACSVFLGDERFCYGNIYQECFQEIWKGARRKKIMEMMENNWNIENCREICRLDEINRYLWELENPPQHVNFI